MSRNDVYDLPHIVPNVICSWCAGPYVVSVDPDGTKYCKGCLPYRSDSERSTK